VHERYRQTDDRQTTDGRAIAYSEREREFTFAKKLGITDKMGNKTNYSIFDAVHAHWHWLRFYVPLNS